MGEREVEAALREAFLAGVRAGRSLEAERVRNLSTGSTGRVEPCTCGDEVPPLVDPPFPSTPTQPLSIPNPHPAHNHTPLARARRSLPRCSLSTPAPRPPG